MVSVFSRDQGVSRNGEVKMGKKNVKRYNLAMLKSLYDEVAEAADRQGISVVDWIRRAINIGLMFWKLKQKGAAIIIRENGVDKHLEFPDFQ